MQELGAVAEEKTESSHDSFESEDDKSRHKNIIDDLEKVTTQVASKITDFFGINNASHFMFLIILGVLSALTGYFIFYVSQAIVNCKLEYS